MDQNANIVFTQETHTLSWVLERQLFASLSAEIVLSWLWMMTVDSVSTKCGLETMDNLIKEARSNTQHDVTRNTVGYIPNSSTKGLLWTNVSWFSSSWHWSIIHCIPWFTKTDVIALTSCPSLEARATLNEINSNETVFSVKTLTCSVHTARKAGRSFPAFERMLLIQDLPSFCRQYDLLLC